MAADDKFNYKQDFGLPTMSVRYTASATTTETGRCHLPTSSPLYKTREGIGTNVCIDTTGSSIKVEGNAMSQGQVDYIKSKCKVSAEGEPERYALALRIFYESPYPRTGNKTSGSGTIRNMRKKMVGNVGYNNRNREDEEEAVVGTETQWAEIGSDDYTKELEYIDHNKGFGFIDDRDESYNRKYISTRMRMYNGFMPSQGQIGGTNDFYADNPIINSLDQSIIFKTQGFPSYDLPICRYQGSYIRRFEKRIEPDDLLVSHTGNNAMYIPFNIKYFAKYQIEKYNEKVADYPGQKIGIRPVGHYKRTKPNSIEEFRYGVVLVGFKYESITKKGVTSTVPKIAFTYGGPERILSYEDVNDENNLREYVQYIDRSLTYGATVVSGKDRLMIPNLVFLNGKKLQEALSFGIFFSKTQTTTFGEIGTLSAGTNEHYIIDSPAWIGNNITITATDAQYNVITNVTNANKPSTIQGYGIKAYF